MIYKRFSHAAAAFENCDKKYKAVFAEPRTSKTSETMTNRNDDNILSDGFFRNSIHNDRATSSGGLPAIMSASSEHSVDGAGSKEHPLNIVCSKNVCDVFNYHGKFILMFVYFCPVRSIKTNYGGCSISYLD